MLSLDGVRVAELGASALVRPKPILELIAEGRPTLEDVLAIRVTSAADGRERTITKPAENHPGKVPTLFAQGGLVAFGLRLEQGGYGDATLDVGAIELVTNRPKAQAPSVFVATGRDPVDVDDDFLQAARGSKLSPRPAERRGHEKDGHDGDRKGDEGEGRGKGEHDGGGDGHAEGGGDGRMGVKLSELVAFHAKGIRVREVVLTDVDRSTFVVDAKLLADRVFDLRLKINGQGQLRFRQFKGTATMREIVKQLEDVKRIEVR